MLDWLGLVVFLPLAGFVLLAAGPWLPRRAVAAIGAGSVGASMVVALAVAWRFLTIAPSVQAYRQVLWDWIVTDGFSPRIALRLDALSLTMMCAVAVVSFLILVYSTRFMIAEEGYGRYFAYMDLFVASMLILVLADDLLLLYLGWEGVGLCSYLLIGFWYRDPINGAAARKAFIVTRAGDAAFLAGLLLLFTDLGTLDIQEMLAQATRIWPAGSGVAIAAAVLVLGGAVGKSAQLPLQVWLPDAMAGPTPVSALIHAATMVTAGVYLIARLHVLFYLAPPIRWLVGLIGAITLLLAGFAALAQWDIKRVLAYSTISQIGYMFLALGVGAASAAIYHFLSHAFFKSLLFLGAGSVILALRQEHDMFRMGGLRRTMPVTFWMFLAGAWSLTALPPSGGFASKGLILSLAWSSDWSNIGFWAAGLIGAFLTGIYTFRMIFLTFLGPPQQVPAHDAPALMAEPLAALAVLVFAAALLNWPLGWGGAAWMTDFLQGVLPGPPLRAQTPDVEAVLEVIYVAAALLGILVAWLAFGPGREDLDAAVRRPVGRLVHSWWASGFGFDWVYDKVFVQPYVRLGRRNREDGVDLAYGGVGSAAQRLHEILSRTQTGRLRWYVAGVAFGTVAAIAIAVWL